MPLFSVLQFDTDEGIELAKAMAFHQGFDLYDQVASDQAPLFTLLVSGLYPVLGWSSSHLTPYFLPRLMVLGFAFGLWWTLGEILRLQLGNTYAWAGLGLLLISQSFLRLSVSIMAGLPAVTLALWAFYGLLQYERTGQKRWVIGSGLAFGLSLQLKMYTLLLAPLLGVYWLIVSLNPRDDRHRFSPKKWPWIPPQLWTFSPWITLGQWVGMGAIAFVMGQLLAGEPLSLDRMLAVHLQDNLQSRFVQENSLRDLCLFYLAELDYTLLAGLGAWQILRYPSTALEKLPIAWLVLASVALGHHKPLWYHHYVMLSPPLVWLAVRGLALAGRTYYHDHWIPFARRFWRRLLPRSYGTIALVLFCLATPVKITLIHQQNQFFLTQTAQYQPTLATLKTYSSQTHWVFTDMPMLPMATHLPIPPEIAVFSRKRVAFGEINETWVNELIQRYQPEQVILGRFPEVKAWLAPYLSAHYRSEPNPIAPKIIHYIRQDIS